jgi:hypothetical protein
MNDQNDFSFDLSRNSGEVSIGVHNFLIKEHFTGSSNGGPYLGYRMECVDQGEDRGKSHTIFLYNTLAARFKLDEFLDAIDAPKKGKATGDMFVGKYIRCSIVANSREKETYKAQVDKFLPAGEIAKPGNTSAKSDSSKVPLDHKATPPF